MKRPEYVAAAVTALRMALDGQQPDMETLQAVFSRSGFTDGYFTGKKQSMFGFRRKEDVLAGNQVLDALAGSYEKPRIVSSLDFSLQLAPDAPALLTAQDGLGRTVQFAGDIPEIPRKSPLTQELLAKSLQKLGGTVYACGTVSLDNPDQLFLSAAQCNALRRGAAERMDTLRIAENTPVCRVREALVHLPALREPEERRQCRLHVRTKAQLAAALQTGEIVCIPPGLAASCEPMEHIFVESPRIIRNEEESCQTLKALRERGFSHLICHNIADIPTGGELGFLLHGGFGLNVTNRLTVQSLAECGLQDICASIELKMPRIAALGKVLPVGAIVYGRLPMMLFRVCPIKAQEGCRQHDCTLTDRTGRTFPLLCSGDYQELVNADVLWLAEKKLPLDQLDFYFTDESPEQIASILRSYREGKEDAPPHRTSGLYFKGGLQ